MGIFMHKYFNTEGFSSDYYGESYKEPWVSYLMSGEITVDDEEPGVEQLRGLKTVYNENGEAIGDYYIWWHESGGGWFMSENVNLSVGNYVTGVTLGEDFDDEYIALEYTYEVTDTNITRAINYSKYDYVLNLRGDADVQYSGFTDSNIPSDLKSLLLRANSGGPFSLKVVNAQSGNDYEFDNFHGSNYDGEGFAFYDVAYGGSGIMSYNSETGLIRIGDTGV